MEENLKYMVAPKKVQTLALPVDIIKMIDVMAKKKKLKKYMIVSKAIEELYSTS